MKNLLQKKIIFGFSLFILIAVVFFSYTDVSQFNKAKQIKTNDDLQPITKSNKLKKENPGLFFKYMNDIKKGFNEDHPGYPANYQIKELLKATNLNSAAGLSKLGKTNVLNWTERGPGNVSGRTRSIVVDPDDATNNTWFVGSVSGGVWKTTDAGVNWTNLTASLPNLATSVLVMAQSNHNIMYLGTGEGFGNIDQLQGSGIWKSTDKGVTWAQLANTANNNFQNVTRIVVDPNDPNVVLASTSAGFKGVTASSGIWKTTDGGTIWNQVYTSASSVEDLIANPLKFNTLYASVNGSGVIKSFDAGNTWFSSASGIGSVLRMEIAISPVDTSKIFGSAHTATTAVLYFSKDGGATWNPTGDLAGNKDWLGGQGWYDNAIAADPYIDTVVYAAGVNIFKLAVSDATTTTPVQINGVDEIDTQSFWAFVNWGGSFAGGGLDTGENFHGLTTSTTSSDFHQVEIRFGPGITQKAHRFLFANNFQYPYQDYVDVPFQVWDTDNNQQLMASFRDQDNDGTWNLKDRASATGGISRDYIFVNALPYNATTPDANITVTAGMAYKNIYAMWPELPSGGTFDPNNLPTSKIVIKYGSVSQNNITTTVLTDAYNQFSGPNNSGSVHPDHHNLTIIKTDVANKKFRMIDGNDGGVTYSDDKGVTFTKTLNGGYNTSQFYGIDKKNGSDRYIGGTQDNGTWVSPTSPNSSSTWFSAPSGDGFEAAWNSSGVGLLLLESSQFNGIYRSIDGGTVWKNINSPTSVIPNGSANAPFITKIENSKLSPNLVFVVGALSGVSGVSRSTDFGATWTGVAVPSAIWSNTSSSSQIKISLADASIVWAGRALITGNTFSVSIDSGKTFTETQSSSLAPNAFISGLATHPTEKNTAYALFSNAKKPKILKTIDLGQTWTDISGFGTGSVSTTGFPDVAVFSLLVMPHNTDIIWAGTEIGVFESTDAGATWHYSNNGLPAVAVWQMRAFNNQVILATHGRGIWTVPLTDITTSVESNTSVIPDNYSLSQNYPNPFNPSTIINFTLPVKSNVNLIIYDALGRKVNEIVNEELPAGLQKVTWNGLSSSGVRTSSGVYFYRLIAKGENGNQFVQSKKMILLK